MVAPHRLTDPKAGPLIAVKLHILTRKTLSGIETDLAARVLKGDGTPITGLYAAGEAAESNWVSAAQRGGAATPPRSS